MGENTRIPTRLSSVRSPWSQDPAVPIDRRQASMGPWWPCSRRCRRSEATRRANSTTVTRGSRGLSLALALATQVSQVGVTPLPTRPLKARSSAIRTSFRTTALWTNGTKHSWVKRPNSSNNRTGWPTFQPRVSLRPRTICTTIPPLSSSQLSTKMALPSSVLSSSARQLQPPQTSTRPTPCKKREAQCLCQESLISASSFPTFNSSVTASNGDRTSVKSSQPLIPHAHAPPPPPTTTLNNLKSVQLDPSPTVPSTISATSADSHNIQLSRWAASQEWSTGLTRPMSAQAPSSSSLLPRIKMPTKTLHPQIAMTQTVSTAITASSIQTAL